MRKLAYVVNVDEITPIEGADRIELARVMGWRAVVKKDAFKVGQKAVFFEIDSFLPMKPEYEFLRASSYRKLKDGTEGYRLKTCKLRGQLSQGLLLPLETVWLPEDIEVGTDVTDLLKVLEWQDLQPMPGAKLGSISKGSGHPFPSFLSKTDEERVQTYNALQSFVDKELYITEKVDGTSMTVFYKADEGRFGVCSRNLELECEEGNAYWDYVKLIGLEERLRNYGQSIALQGELFGAGIQSNPYKMKIRQVLWFNVYDITNHARMDYYAMHGVLASLKLSMVPELDIKVDASKVLDRDYWLKLAEGKSVLGDTEREGIVIRQRRNTEYSFKAISNKYLLVSE